MISDKVKLQPEVVEAVVIRFVGDSGDGMQLTGTQFSDTSAMFGNDIATFPNYPSEIRAPQGSLYGVSGFQVHIGSVEVSTPGDNLDLLVAMNPAGLKTNLYAVKPGHTIIVDTDAFSKKNLEKAQYATNPLEDGSLENYRVIQVDMSSLTKESLKGVEGLPKPVHGRIPVINAGSSEQGRDYAAKNADFIFTVVDNPTDGAEVVKLISENAKNKYQRKSGVLTLGHVVCRPTNSQVDEFIDYYANKNADWVAVDNMMALMGQYAKSFTPEMLATYRTRFAAGDGSCPLTGTPDEVADRIYQFAKAGFSGMTIAFFDYTKELPYFAFPVLLLLR